MVKRVSLEVIIKCYYSIFQLHIPVSEFQIVGGVATEQFLDPIFALSL